MPSWSGAYLSEEILYMRERGVQIDTSSRNENQVRRRKDETRNP